jgi:hypothetical protein
MAAVFGAEPAVSLTLVPPSPVTEQIAVEVRAAVRNGGDQVEAAQVEFYLDEENPAKLVHRERVEVPAMPSGVIRYACGSRIGSIFSARPSPASATGGSWPMRK